MSGYYSTNSLITRLHFCLIMQLEIDSTGLANSFDDFSGICLVSAKLRSGLIATPLEPRIVPRVTICTPRPSIVPRLLSTEPHTGDVLGFENF